MSYSRNVSKKTNKMGEEMQFIVIIHDEYLLSDLVTAVINKTLFNVNLDYRIIVLERIEQLLSLKETPSLIIKKAEYRDLKLKRRRIINMYPFAKFIYISRNIDQLYEAVDYNVVGFCLVKDIGRKLDEQIHNWLETMLNTEEYYVYDYNNTLFSIPYRDIKIIRYQERRVYIYTFDNKEHDLGFKSFKSVYQKFDSNQIAQISCNLAINITAISAIKKDWIIIKDSSQKLKVSVMYLQNVREVFSNYLTEFQ